MSGARESPRPGRPLPGKDLEAEAQKAADIVRQAPEVADVHVFSKAESEKLLEPWLGSGLDLAALPVPRLVVVKLKDNAPAPDLTALRKSMAEKVPGASLDDHRLWLRRLAAMADTIVFVAIGIFALVVIAMAFAVAFATRGADEVQHVDDLAISGHGAAGGGAPRGRTLGARRVPPAGAKS